MAYAVLDDNGRILDVVNDYVDSSIEIDEDTLMQIAQDRLGHINYVYDGHQFIYDPVKISSEAKDGDVIVNPEQVSNPVLHTEVSPHEIGVFGNVWVRKLYFPTKDTIYEGHKHDHDHVSLLMSGSVSVEVEGFEPKEFKAPTYIVIRAEYEHKVTALEDNTIWWCIHAIRDDSGEVVDVYGDENDPLAGGR